MSIFRRDTSLGAPLTGPAAGSPAALEGEGLATRIAPGTRVEGGLSGGTEVLVEGEVEGEIRVDAAVVVGAGGVVRGPISARTVQVTGKVVGDVHGAERVEVGSAGTVEGDIAAPRVVIAEGAFFKGTIEMRGDRARDERLRMRGPAEPAKGD